MVYPQCTHHPEYQQSTYGMRSIRLTNTSRWIGSRLCLDGTGLAAVSGVRRLGGSDEHHSEQVVRHPDHAPFCGQRA